MENSFIIANITWNPTGWRSTYINPKAGHRYAREYPGHESLNFRFDKKGIDTDRNVFGYVQWRPKPKQFKKDGTIIFFSKNTDTNQGLIVGIYSNVEIFEKTISKKWKGFENDKIELNIKADKSYSMLFPIPLEANKYKNGKKSKRLVGQVGYSYYTTSMAEKIILDELYELSKSEIQENEFQKLKNIYSLISGKKFNSEIFNSDETEQQELTNYYRKKKSDILNDLKSLKSTDVETVIVQQKSYKRDNKTIAQLKILRDFKCQICGTSILKNNGEFYVEAAHIKSKRDKGIEIPDNILILCPNHHKEFDYGSRQIKTHAREKIIFVLNGKEYKIDLSVN